MSKVRDVRRQQFITESYYVAMRAMLKDECAYWKHGLVNAPGSENSRRFLSLRTFVTYSLDMWLLRYTAGEPLETLRGELETVIEALEHAKAERQRMKELSYIPPLEFGEIDEYESFLQLLSASILLHRLDLFERLTAMFDPGFKGEDAIYEKLAAFRQEGRVEVDELCHKRPYKTLLQAMREETKEKAADTLKRYCKEWYPGLKQATWHDSHLRINGDDGDYFGYWAFEAGAVAYLYDLDDSKIDHMVYPRDLVAFARNFKG